MSNAIGNWRRQQNQKKLLGKTGEIITWTEIFVSAPGYQKDTPFIGVLVKMDSGDMSYGQLVDCHKETIKRGAKVKSVLRIIDGDATPEEIITYGLKFTPVS